MGTRDQGTGPLVTCSSVTGRQRIGCVNYTLMRWIYELLRHNGNNYSDIVKSPMCTPFRQSFDDVQSACDQGTGPLVTCHTLIDTAEVIRHLPSAADGPNGVPIDKYIVLLRCTDSIYGCHTARDAHIKHVYDGYCNDLHTPSTCEYCLISRAHLEGV